MSQSIAVASTFVLAFVATNISSGEEGSEKTPQVPQVTTGSKSAEAAEKDGVSPSRDVLKRLDAVEKELADLKKNESFKSDPLALRASWKDGLRFDSQDQNVQVQIGGRIQNDWAWFNEEDDLIDQVGNSQDGTQFRRARLQMQGLLFKRLEFKAEYEFARRAGTGEVGGPGFRDVYIGVLDIPYVGDFRAGHFKEPFSLEELTPDTEITFMERSLASIFPPSRNTGVAIQNRLLDQRMTWAAGVFRDDGGDDFGFNQVDGKYNGSARLTGVPVYESNGETLLHLGAAYSYRNPNTDSVRLRQRPESNLALRYVDTGNLVATEQNEFGAEVATVLGPLSLQGEFMGSLLNATGGADDPFFFGCYATASYFLTGEPRPYELARGAFGRIRPKSPVFNGKGGLGAWEIAARYSYLSLDDEAVDGGQISDVTGALNWYPTVNFRVALNYVYSHLEGAGDAHIAMARFQIVF